MCPGLGMETRTSWAEATALAGGGLGDASWLKH